MSSARASDGSSPRPPRGSWLSPWLRPETRKGYSHTEATERLARNHGMIASFSRGLTEGLSVTMSDEEFTDALERSIAEVYAASIT